MKRLLLGLLFLGFGQLAVAASLVEGENYVAIEPAPPVGNGEKIEVVEFFWYGCPHCYQFEPFLNAWLEKKPGNVEFVRIPAMFGGAANMHGAAFYALEIMGEGERMHEKIFQEMHDRKNKMKTRDALEAYLEKEGVDMDKFRAAMSSFTVQTKAKRAASLAMRYGISGVPSVVVDGRYRNERMSSYQQYIDLLDHLVAKVQEQRAGAQ
ncbi:MAG: thiol:disulfide interchange protein DsbA/DsbL [bacterium]